MIVLAVSALVNLFTGPFKASSHNHPTTKSVLVPHMLDTAAQDRRVNAAIRKMSKRGWIYSGTEHSYGGIRVSFVAPRATPVKGRKPIHRNY